MTDSAINSTSSDVKFRRLSHEAHYNVTPGDMLRTSSKYDENGLLVQGSGLATDAAAGAGFSSHYTFSTQDFGGPVQIVTTMESLSKRA